MKQNYKIYIPIVTILVIGSIAIFYSYSSKNSNPYAHQLKLYEKYRHLAYEEIEKLPKQDRPDLAALQHFEMTKDPKLGYPPVERKVQAYEKLIAEYNKNGKSQRAITNVLWDERGPNNVGGRTRALMFDPNDATNKKVWAGGISGGLWVNDDITNQTIGWTNIDDFMSSLSIATLAYDPSNTTTFYLGTGERFTYDFQALGIWKSIDGGITWNWLANTADFSYVPKMVVTFNSTIIAATSTGIKRSTDGGSTWTSPSVVNVDMADVELTANGDLFSGDFSGNVYKSIDDGVTWSTITPSASAVDRVEIGVSETNSSIIYAIAVSGGDVAWFMKSINGGTDWTPVEIPMYTEQDCSLSSTSDFTRSQAWYDLIIGVHPTDPNIVIVGGIDLSRSTDGGTTWELVSYWTGGCDTYVHADQHAIVFNSQNPNTAIFGTDGGVFYSSDIGSAVNPVFLERNKDYNVTQFYAATMVNEVASDEFLAGAQDNGTQKFSTPGVNSTSRATGGDGGFCHIDQDNPNIQITSYVYSNYYLSTNRGVSFTTLNSDVANLGRFINPTEYDSDADILYGAGDVNQITKIANISTTPSALEIITLNISDRQITTIKASPYTANRLFIGVRVNLGEGLIFMIDNADTSTPTVTEVSSFFDAARGGWVSSIDVGASDDQLLATFSNYGVHSIFETIDGGTLWLTKEGNLDDIPVYSGLYNPNNRKEVLLATELGVWSCDDISVSSPDWGTTNIGLANVSTRMLKYRNADGLILAATHGRGLFSTSSFSPEISAAFTIDSEITYSGHAVTFTNKSIGTIDNVLWDFGDGYTSTEVNPIHTYGIPGNYLVKLEVNNGISSIEKGLLVLSNKDIPYTLAEGGNFDTNVNDFYAHSAAGTPFELGNSTIVGKDGTSSGSNAWVVGLNDANYADGTLSYLQSPAFDFSATGIYTISFKAKYQLESEGSNGAWDSFWIEYSTNFGNTWTKIGAVVETNWYNQLTHSSSDVNLPNIPVFSGTSSGFETFSKDISSLAGTNRIAFRIVFMADNATTDVGLVIDDFEINGPDSTPIPDFSSTNPAICIGKSVIYNDFSTGTISGYSWDFGVGATPETASGAGPHEVVYASIGNYTTALTVTGPGGDVLITKNNYVTVSGELVVDNVISSDISTFNSCETVSAIVTVATSTLGIKYQLLNGNTNNVEGGYIIGDGTDLTLTTALLSDTIVYFVQATNSSGCKTLLSTPLTFTLAGPNTKNVVSNVTSSICSGDNLNITVENSDMAIVYKLIDQTDNSTITTLIGDGNDLVFSTDTLTQSISWSITGSTSLNDCTIQIGDLINIDVFILPDASIVQNGSVLEVASGATSYQWYLNGDPIFGATNNTHDAIFVGTYTCEVVFNDCISISTDFATTIVSTEELNNRFLIFPNPTFSGIINVESKPNSIITIFNTSGKVVYRGSTKSKISTIDISGHANGMYIIEINNYKEITKHRINLIK